MREIKFRAWDSESKTWVYIQLIRNQYTCQLNTSYLAHANYSDWLQFTGLKDKNGKEVYEGDIIEGLLSDNEHEIQEVCWDEDREFIGWNIEPQWEQSMEIIGNIYENPELLKN